MEGLNRTSKGLWRSSSDLYAVEMLRNDVNSPDDNGVSQFTYRATPTSEMTIIEWDNELNICLLKPGIANFIVGKGYARWAGDELAGAWNGAIDYQPVEVSGEGDFDGEPASEGGEANSKVPTNTMPIDAGEDPSAAAKAAAGESEGGEEELAEEQEPQKTSRRGRGAKQKAADTGSET